MKQLIEQAVRLQDGTREITRVGYFHTKEELIELFKGLLDKAAQKAEIKTWHNFSLDENDWSKEIDRNSITNILPDYLNEIGL